MTVGELLQALSDVPLDTPVGTFDQDDVLCVTQTAQYFVDGPVFMLRALGGVPLYEDNIDSNAGDDQ